MNKPLARLGVTPMSTTGYPWVDGDILYAADLNAAFVPVTGGGAMSGGLTITSGPLRIDNNEPIQMKDTSGTYRSVLYVDTSNNTQIGSPSGNTTIGGLLTLGGAGIVYAQSGGHEIALGWDGTYLTVFADNLFVGSVPTTAYTIATYVPFSGGTMTGALTLAGNATAALQPVTLQQANATFLPAAGGTVSGDLTVSNVLHVNGEGITYSQSATHVIAFGYNGTQVTSFVDNVFIGPVVTMADVDALRSTVQELADRVAALEGGAP
jgi:hypothetical protein